MNEEEVIYNYPVETRVLYQVPSLGIYTHGKVVAIRDGMLRIRADIDGSMIDVDFAVLSTPITRNSIVVPSPLAGIWQGYRGEQQ